MYFGNFSATKKDICVVDISDTEMIAVGHLEETHKKMIFISKLRRDGEFLWSKTFFDDRYTIISNNFRMSATAKDGSFYVLGRAYHSGYDSFIFLKVSAVGNLEWAKAIKIQNDHLALPKVILPTEHSFLITTILGLIKLDTNGNFHFAKVFEKSNLNLWIESADYDNDGNLLTFGNDGKGSSIFHFQKISRDGNLIFEKAVMGSYQSQFSGVVGSGLVDGEFIVTIPIRDGDTSPYFPMIAVLKNDGRIIRKSVLIHFPEESKGDMVVKQSKDKNIIFASNFKGDLVIGKLSILDLSVIWVKKYSYRIQEVTKRNKTVIREISEVNQISIIENKGINVIGKGNNPSSFFFVSLNENGEFDGSIHDSNFKSIDYSSFLQLSDITTNLNIQSFGVSLRDIQGKVIVDNYPMEKEDFFDSITEDIAQVKMENNCQSCINDKLSFESGCSSCVAPKYDFSTQCTTCSNAEYTIENDCEDKEVDFLSIFNTVLLVGFLSTLSIAVVVVVVFSVLVVVFVRIIHETKKKKAKGKTKPKIKPLVV